MSLALAALLLLQEAAGLLDRGRRLLEERDLPAAERVFRELVSMSPEDSRASYYLGVALSRQDRTEEAVAAFEDARRFAKSPNPSILYELGTAFSKLERWPEAESFLKQATDLAPEEPAVRLQLGWVYYSTLQGEKAREEFRRAIDVSPSAKAFLYLGLTEIGLGANEPAIEALEEAVRLDPRHLEAHVALGKVLARAGREEEATPVLVRALSLDGTSAEAHFQLGLIALRRGDLDAASRSFEAAIDSDSEHLQAWYNRALVSERLGRKEDARAAWVRVQELRASGAADLEAKRRTRAR
jgi:Flp pilus assembly protein TadD